MSTKPNRNVVLYVTIDPCNHRSKSGALRGHGPNLERVRHAAGSWAGDAVVQDVWCADLRPEALAGPELLALFLSGSYTEWVEVFRQPSWLERLDSFCEQIRTTSVPILAVCGSHQLVARAFSGWSAVGHMVEAGGTATCIAEESDGCYRAPDPRIGEVGTFHFERIVEDPLFSRIGSASGGPLIFSQWHSDQVFEHALPAGVVSLLRPGEFARARLSPEGEQQGTIATGPGEPPTAYRRRHVASDADLCRTQALRYNVPPAGRLLYTTQFHPDLPGTDTVGSPDHGIELIHRFLDLAAEYWSSAALDFSTEASL
jgi:GMP synthase-like glutamine amidotransferase